MNYPKYLQIGNWLFVHIRKSPFVGKNPVGGPIPENLYIAVGYYAPDLSQDLRTYEGLIEYGAEIPNDEELLRLLK